MIWLLMFAQVQDGRVALSAQPAVAVIERGDSGQTLSVDLVIDNPGAKPVEIQALEAKVYDAQGRFLAARHLSGNGGTIDVIPRKRIEPGAKLLIFSPLERWNAGIRIAKIRYIVTLAEDDGPEFDRVIDVATANPLRSAPLRLPLDGEILVHSGHDLLSHHRRFDTLSPMAKALHIQVNPTRYAYDLVVPGDDGELHRGDGKRRSDWHGWNKPILAPAAGTVVFARDGQPDNDPDAPPKLDRGAVMADPTLLSGNHVVIDHGDGSFSLLAHMAAGSVAMKAGDRVKAGQQIGRVGMSGDASLPHLHYQLQRGPGLTAGIPSRFARLRRKSGAGWQARSGPTTIETGDIVSAIP